MWIPSPLGKVSFGLATMTLARPKRLDGRFWPTRGSMAMRVASGQSTTHARSKGRFGVQDRKSRDERGWRCRRREGHVAATLHCAASSPTRLCETELEAYFHEVPSGLKLEVLRQKPLENTGKPPLVFLHGSYHAAWCWNVHFMPYFAQRGYDSYAISFRGQGKSDVPEGSPAGLLEEHTSDIQHFLGKLDMEPVLLGHSFGGLVVQNYVRLDSPPVKAIGLLNSVPPSGNQDMIMRYLIRMPIKSLRITYSFVAQAFSKDPKLCRETFFSEDLPEETLRHYMDLLRTSSKSRLVDLQALRKSVPIRPPRTPVPAFVLGGAKDAVVDLQGLEETARAYDTPAVLVPNLAHDCMLDAHWEEAAGAILTFLEDL